MERPAYHWCEGHGAHEPRWVIHKVEKHRGYVKRLRELGGEDQNQGDEDEESGTPNSESPSHETSRNIAWSTTVLAQVRRSADEDSD